jgi:endonuclease G, mitochondrial
MRRRETPLDPAVAAELEALEAALPFNCEHVVPQSSFAAKEPMRGDLHHLFTCESGCNSFRGNTPYFDFEDVHEAVRDKCGRREGDRFEPSHGKGPVARATFYFLLRYPGLVGDAPRELQADRLPILLAWHRSEPVGAWERHRNAAIFELQGNRNPFIDHPEWAERVPFVLANARRPA